MLGIPYVENSNDNEKIFAPKIFSTKAYAEFKSALKVSTKKTINTSLAFEKSDNSDLFYALHLVDAYATKSGKNCNVHLHDVFDFAVEKNYESLFTALVNNWAYLCQYKSAILHKIDIHVYFNALV